MVTNNSMVAYLISEAATISTPKIITNRTGVDSVIIDAILQDSSEFNRNTRNYPKPVVSNGLGRENVTEMIAKKSWVGEAGHPVNPTIQRQMSIDPGNISHRILNYRWEGDILKGNVESLLTARGRDFRDLVRQQLEVAFSLRAVGPVKKTERGNVVQDPLSIVTYDWVFVPSHKKAYQQSIIQDNNPNVLSESYFIALNESAISYIKDESKNLKLVSEGLEFKMDSVILSEDLRTITIVDNKNKNQKLVVGVEKYISSEIDSYFNKFR